jgi:hypothetical protein
MKIRPDLLDKDSPRGLEVIQLTDEALPSSHVYMEAQIFAPDSKHFILHRSAHAHGSDKSDPEHRYLLCDIEDRCSLHPLTTEKAATGPSITPDGRFLYYFVDETVPGGGRLALKRVRLDGSARQTVMVLDGPLPGTRYRASRLYPLSTISSDGKRLAISGYLGDGSEIGAPFGLMVFDLEKAAVELVLEGQSWCNLHPQYSRSLEDEASHDILVQENHGNQCNPQGGIVKLTGGAGADIHVIRDNGTRFRALPWGRDGQEFCQGHQCWRGRTTWAITSTSKMELIESEAVNNCDHLGLWTCGGQRNDLSRDFAAPGFCHFATDIRGKTFISDCGPRETGGRLFVAEFGEPGAAALRFKYLLNPRSSWRKETHVHPFLSPDGKTGFFNSDESGVLQAYLVRGW